MDMIILTIYTDNRLILNPVKFLDFNHHDHAVKKF